MHVCKQTPFLFIVLKEGKGAAGKDNFRDASYFGMAGMLIKEVWSYAGFEGGQGTGIV